MDQELLKLYDKFKKRGLTPRQEQKILAELEGDHCHDISVAGADAGAAGSDPVSRPSNNVYGYTDFSVLQGIHAPQGTYITCLRSVDELLERDKQREADGFPRKIRIGRLIKPGKGDKDKVVVVPTTVEEKFIHDAISQSPEDQQEGGSGEGEEGETVGEEPLRPQETAQGSGPGEGDDAQHEMESNAYDMGKILTEKFELPNLKDKGKKRSLTRYTYDMTDRHRGFGQIIDKKATLREIVETNICLGNLPDIGNIDPTNFLISPNDKIYRILSREKDYEAQAMVFFLRDYSGSMLGKATELVVSQHVLIYSWLLYQYARQVESRFIVHDTKAKEVKDFYTYYNSKVAGGTQVSSAYRLVNDIVENENLVQDYNIYIFHGTDGDDWDTSGAEAVPELKKMLIYANRIGITIAEHASGQANSTEVENYLKKSKLLDEKPELLRLDILQEDSDEQRLIEGIKTLISE
jgi:uncharacterized sporulation protein YeaH/YhbH (DUF444 family)